MRVTKKQMVSCQIQEESNKVFYIFDDKVWAARHFFTFFVDTEKKMLGLLTKSLALFYFEYFHVFIHLIRHLHYLISHWFWLDFLHICCVKPSGKFSFDVHHIAQILLIYSIKPKNLFFALWNILNVFLIIVPVAWTCNIFNQKVIEMINIVIIMPFWRSLVTLLPQGVLHEITFTVYKIISIILTKNGD